MTTKKDNNNYNLKVNHGKVKMRSYTGSGQYVEVLVSKQTAEQLLLEKKQAESELENFKRAMEDDGTIFYFETEPVKSTKSTKPEGKGRA